MPITKKEIRRILKAQKYDTFAVSDLATFPELAARNEDGEFSEKAVDSYETYLKWVRGTQPNIPVLRSPQSARGFVAVTNRLNGDLMMRVAECSNFAYHAVGTLLQDPKVRAQYNVVVIGTMEGRHNIAVLVPIGEKIPVSTTGKLREGYKFPEGSLIVDPWAVGMGHSSRVALAVTPDKFVFQASLYKGVTVHYQSAEDPSLKDLATSQPAAKTKTDAESPVVEKPRKKKSRKEEEPAVAATSSQERSSPQPRATQEVSKPPEKSSRPSTSPSSQPAKQAAINPKSYGEYAASWQGAFDTIMYARQSSLTGKQRSDQATIHAIRTVLNEYTQGGNSWTAWFKRVVSGHWNRHHVDSVSQIVDKIDQNRFKKPEALLKELDNLAVTAKISETGNLHQRLSFFKQSPNEQHTDLVEGANSTPKSRPR